MTDFLAAFIGYPLSAVAFTMATNAARRRLAILNRGWRGFRDHLMYLWTGGSAVGIVLGVTPLETWWFGAGSAASLAVALTVRWWRKNRRRVRKLAGAKARALRDALVARMRQPRPPLPQGG